jgi:hypothetical protein
MSNKIIGEKIQLKSIKPFQCRFCNKDKPKDNQSWQTDYIPTSHIGIIKNNINRKYLTSRDFYNVKVVNDIIYNEQMHVVSVFKDFLILDDISEFLK